MKKLIVVLGLVLVMLNINAQESRYRASSMISTVNEESGWSEYEHEESSNFFIFSGNKIKMFFPSGTERVFDQIGPVEYGHLNDLQSSSAMFVDWEGDAVEISVAYDDENETYLIGFEYTDMIIFMYKTVKL